MIASDLITYSITNLQFLPLNTISLLVLQTADGVLEMQRTKTVVVGGSVAPTPSLWPLFRVAGGSMLTNVKCLGLTILIPASGELY